MPRQPHPSHSPAAARHRNRWLAMSTRQVGSVTQLVQQGQGKLSAVGGDPGEPRKQQGV